MGAPWDDILGLAALVNLTNQCNGTLQVGFAGFQQINDLVVLPEAANTRFDFDTRFDRLRDALIEETGKESQTNCFLLHTPGSAFLISQKFTKQLGGLCFLFVVALFSSVDSAAAQIKEKNE